MVSDRTAGQKDRHPHGEESSGSKGGRLSPSGDRKDKKEDSQGWKTRVVSGRVRTYLQIQREIVCSAEKTSLGVPHPCPKTGPPLECQAGHLGKPHTGTDTKMQVAENTKNPQNLTLFSEYSR